MSYIQYETLDGSVKQIDGYTVRILESGMFRIYKDQIADCYRAYSYFHAACLQIGTKMKSSGEIHNVTVQLIDRPNKIVASVEFKHY